MAHQRITSCIEACNACAAACNRLRRDLCTRGSGDGTRSRGGRGDLRLVCADLRRLRRRVRPARHGALQGMRGGLPPMRAGVPAHGEGSKARRRRGAGPCTLMARRPGEARPRAIRPVNGRGAPAAITSSAHVAMCGKSRTSSTVSPRARYGRCSGCSEPRPRVLRARPLSAPIRVRLPCQRTCSGVACKGRAITAAMRPHTHFCCL